MIEMTMALEELIELHDRYKLEKPNLFALAQPDAAATPQQVAKVERAIGVLLPTSYKDFLEKFGGGSIGYLTIYSANEASENYILQKKVHSSVYLPEGLLPFSDDYSGGHYAFKIEEGMAGEDVHYWNIDGGLRKTEFDNVLAFIARYAFEPA